MNTGKSFADKELIKSFLNEKNKNISIITLKETSSTNDEVKSLALIEKNKTLLCVADSQTKGRGRMGRSFFSPDGTGIYMSLLLHPDLAAEQCPLLTPLCAVAVSEAIEKVVSVENKIKWVNDIYVGGRKVAGILTEGAFKNGKIDYAVVGIGVNLSLPEGDFPEDIRSIAGALTENTADFKNELIAEIINRFMYYYELLPEKEFLQKYREKLFFLGQEITVISSDGSYNAVAEDTDEMCRLIVRNHKGERIALGSGEISIKIQ